MNNISTPMQYSPGVLVGNWYEDMRVREDKVAFYKSMLETRGSYETHGDTISHLSEVRSLDELRGGVVVIGQPLQLVNVATGAALALDTVPQMCPKPNEFLVSATDTPQPQIRSTWVIHRAKDENNAAYTRQLKEEHVLHYGQHVRIVNEDASPTGFCYLHSGVKDIGNSEEQPLTAALDACKDNIFVVVKPNTKRDDIRDGDPVLVGETVAFYHAATNRPIRCAKTRRRTSFGFEFEVNCSFAGRKFSRSLGAITSHPENLFLIGASTQTSQGAMAAASSTTSPLRSRTGRPETMLLSMSGGIGLELIMARIREGALHFGGRLGLRAISKALGIACNEQRTTLLDRYQVREGVALMGVDIQPVELDVIFRRFDHDGDGLIVGQELLRELRGEMSPCRLEAVVRSFQQLLVEGGGSVDFKDMLNLFKVNTPMHPDVKEGVISCEEAICDFVNCWPGMNGTTSVTLDGFVAYYTDLSPTVKSDERFVTTVRNCWVVPESNAYMKGAPKRFVTVRHLDDSLESIGIPSSLAIDLRDSAAVRGILVQHGVKNIKEILPPM